MEKRFRKEEKPLQAYSERKPSEGAVRGALVIRNGKVVEISLEEYRELGGVLHLNERGVYGEIITDKSHAH